MIIRFLDIAQITAPFNKGTILAEPSVYRGFDTLVLHYFLIFTLVFTLSSIVEALSYHICSNVFYTLFVRQELSVLNRQTL